MLPAAAGRIRSPSRPAGGKHRHRTSDYIYSDAQRYDAVTETYRSCLARIDRALAAAADTVLEVSAGTVFAHKGVYPL